MERAGPGLRSALHALASWAQTHEQVTQVQHLVVSLADKYAPTFADDGAHVVDDGARGGGAHAAGVQVFPLQ